MEELMKKLKEKNLIDDAGNVVLEKYPSGGYQAVDCETFMNFFGNTNYSYEQLVAADQGKGYKRFFDNWKEVGVL